MARSKDMSTSTLSRWGRCGISREALKVRDLRLLNCCLFIVLLSRARGECLDFWCLYASRWSFQVGADVVFYEPWKFGGFVYLIVVSSSYFFSDERREAFGNRCLYDHLGRVLEVPKLEHMFSLLFPSFMIYFQLWSGAGVTSEGSGKGMLEVPWYCIRW